MPNYEFNVPRGRWPNVKGASIIKPPPTVGSQSRADTRKILREVWNGNTRIYPTTAGAKNRWMSNGFRAVMNASDPLGRKNYSCGGPNMISGVPSMGFYTSRDGGQSRRNCDGSGVEPSTCNVKYVYDSSDVTRYRREKAINKGYSWKNTSSPPSANPPDNNGFDYSYGGANNGAQEALSRVRH
jgi:hypothetical protein